VQKLNETTYGVSKTPFIDIEVGDITQPTFLPQVKSKHWDNECNFSVRLAGSTTNVFSDEDGVVTYINGNKTVRFYENDTGDEYGGFEFDISFAERPNNNTIHFTLQQKNLVAYRQDELTQDDYDNAAAMGLTLHPRPENLIGSYAFYHNSKKNNEYKTGKVLEIKRPWAIDSVGTQVWCELNITGNAMSITIPQDFVDNAVYPILVDPTFGYTSIGGSTFSGGSIPNHVIFTANGTGTVTQMSVYLNKNFGGTQNTQTAIYSDSSGAPNSRLATSSSTSISGTSQWYNFTISQAITNAVDYWLSWWDEDAGTVDFRYDSGGTDQFCTTNTGNTPFSWPATAGSPNYSSVVVSIYATYTSAGTTVDTATGQTTFDGFAPTVTVSNNISVATALGQATFTGFEPTVNITNHVSVLSATGQAVFTGLEPTVSVTNNISVATDLGQAVFTGFEPTISISNHINVSTDTGVGVFTGFEPTVSVSGNGIVNTDTGVGVFTGFEPTISVSNNIDVQTDTGQGVFAGFAPVVSVSDHITVNTDKGDAVFNGFAPTVTASNHITVDTQTGQGIFTGYEPTVVASNAQVVNTSTGLGVFTGYSPSVIISSALVKQSFTIDFTFVKQSYGIDYTFTKHQHSINYTFVKTNIDVDS
jgi:hypothetical protein